MVWRVGSILILVLIFIALANNGKRIPDDRLSGYQQVDGVYHLAQNWDAEVRERFAFTSFGSRIIPYAWFLALEVPGTDTLLRSDAVLTSLGFIATSPGAFNPDGLPIGFSRDKDASDAREWVGLTCAACHTGQVTVNQQPLRIEGGQALIDYTAFEQLLLKSLRATHTSDDVFTRFAKRAGVSVGEHSALREELAATITWFETRYAINAVDVPYGAGRLDAFGQIFNAIAVEALDQPENRRAPDAPTSFPVLWDASHLDVVQWNGSAPNVEPGPLLQNATTALAVYGKVNIDPHKRFYSSTIRLQNLGWLQARLYELSSPRWPEFVAGVPDTLRVSRGAGLYQQHCLECHELVDRADSTRKLRPILTPLDEINTDRRMAENFVNARVKTGVLEGRKQWVLVGDAIPAETSSLNVVMHVTVGSLLKSPLQTLKAVWREFAWNYLPQSHDNLVYKARPLNGVWSSAPYLHNGSVPTLDDLLRPAEERPLTFFVGSRELDREKVGLLSLDAPGHFLFDTRLPGNGNGGHEYGTDLTAPERAALLEYLKTL